VDPHRLLAVGIWEVSLAIDRAGGGGLWEQFPHQGLDPVSIMKRRR
jgi:hypothetical protein